MGEATPTTLTPFWRCAIITLTLVDSSNHTDK